MNILAIVPSFYGYHLEIKKSLLKKYDKVFMYPELPTRKIAHYYLIERVSLTLANIMWDYYERKILNDIRENNIEEILLIRGYKLRESLFLKILSINKNIKIFNYQWDSLKNNPNSELISKYAYRNFSFDRVDTEKNPLYKYVPLFYIDSCPIVQQENLNYDFLIVASWNRYREDLLSMLERKYPDLKFYIHLPVGGIK